MTTIIEGIAVAVGMVLAVTVIVLWQWDKQNKIYRRQITKKEDQFSEAAFKRKLKNLGIKQKRKQFEGGK